MVIALKGCFSATPRSHSPASLWASVCSAGLGVTTSTQAGQTQPSASGAQRWSAARVKRFQSPGHSLAFWVTDLIPSIHPRTFFVFLATEEHNCLAALHLFRPSPTGKMSMLRKTKQQIAHTSMIPSLGNRDLRSLQDVINSEKAFIKANSNSSQAWHSNAESLKAWGDGEGEDLSVSWCSQATVQTLSHLTDSVVPPHLVPHFAAPQDILSKMSLLFDHYTTAQTRFDSHLATLRLHFKSIRTREEGLADLKAKKRSLASKIEGVEKKLAKMGPENKELMKTTSTLKEYRNEMEGLRIEVMTEEAAIGDFKRRTTKEAMGLKCGGLLELAEKLTIVAEVGKMIIDEVPLETTTPGMPRADYNGHARTDQLLQEASRSISDVGFAPNNASFGGGGVGGHRPDISHADTDYADDSHRAGGIESNQDDAYAGANTYNAAGDISHTPIYASHQTTQPWLYGAEQASQDHGEAQDGSVRHGSAPHDDEDPTPERWGQSTDAALAGSAEGKRATYDASHVADDLPDPSKPWRNSTIEGGAGGSSSNHGYGPGSASGHGALPTIPGPRPDDSRQQHLDSTSGAPSLPPLRASSPLPGGVTGTTADQQEQDNQSYFTAVGSTRAAQAAARNPASPSSNRYSTMMSNSTSANSLAAMGATAASQQTSGGGGAGYSTHEPAESGGRKMTAAAFRKGFNRMPSAQHGSTSNLASPAGEYPPALGIPSREGTSSPAPGVAPLAIRKRHSALQDAEPRDEEAVPPYAPAGAPGASLQPGHQVYQHGGGSSQGHSAAYDTNGYDGQYAPPQPHYHGYQHDGSRPSTPSRLQYHQQPTPYGAAYAAGPSQ